MPETQKSLSQKQAGEINIVDEHHNKSALVSATSFFKVEQAKALDMALAYIGKGWPVFPCHTPMADGTCSCQKPDCGSNGKHPRTANGVKDATTDEAMIRQWWNQWPNANIAIATGQHSGLLVLDVDPRHGGNESLVELKAEITHFPETVESITGGGGQHLLFSHPNESVKNRVSFRPGLDLKSDGGYIIAPPSLHVSGKSYAWEVCHHPDTTTLAACPEPFLAIIKSAKTTKTTPKAHTPMIPEGERNSTLFREAARLVQKGLAQEEVRNLVNALNQSRCEPPLPEAEVCKIIESALTYQNGDADGADLPAIIINGVQRRKVSKDAIASLVLANQNELSLFIRGNGLVRVRSHSKNGPMIEPVTENILEHILSRSANWFSVNAQGALKPSQCPAKVIRDILAETDWPFPTLEGISKIPLFTTTGTIQTQSGYDAKTGYWLDFKGVIDLPEEGGQAAREAVRFLTIELLADFPFKDEASRAHAMAALLLPFVRPLIDEPTPLHLFDASTPGSGKSLLASVISLIVTGRDPAMMTEAGNADEWRKKLTAALIQAPNVLVLDNLSKKLDSGDLAAALTTNQWADRLLGRSEIVQIPVKTLWLATGNNVQLSHELARRVVWCRLQPQEERPWENRQFQHPNLMRWVKENRLNLIRAILIIICDWFKQGCPAGTLTLGSYQQWASIMGGILQNAGIDGFLENRDELHTHLDEEAQQWGAFVSIWWERFQDCPVTVGDLFMLASETEALPDLLGSGNEQSRKTILGKSLSGLRDRVISGFIIGVTLKASRNGARRYFLKSIKST